MATFWQEILARPLAVFQRMSKGQRTVTLAVIALGFVAVVAGTILANRPSWKLLYAGLDQEQAALIVERLDEEGISYRIQGSAIEVEEHQVDRTRLLLAQQGLPSVGGVGFEIFDDFQLGMTDALLDIQLERAVAGEVRRAIESVDAVRKAKVIVQLPKPSPYSRQRESPSAGITLSLRPGFVLSHANVAAMAHLAAACIGHGIKSSDVTITDHEMNRLHPLSEEDTPFFAAHHLQVLQSLEKHLQSKAESQLLAAVGPGKASVRVSAELDLTYKERQSETRDPKNRVVLREESTSSTVMGTSGAGGDPSGAAPDSELSGQSEQNETTVSESLPGLTRDLSITNGGAIKRLSVALLLDEGDAELTAAKDKLADLVKNAVGFEPERDTFSVQTLKFVKPEEPELEAGGFELTDLMGLAAYLVEAITVVFVLTVLLRAVRGGKKEARTAETGAGEVEEPPPDVRTRLSQLVQDDPEKAREALLTWLREEVAA